MNFTMTQLAILILAIVFLIVIAYFIVTQTGETSAIGGGLEMIWGQKPSS